MKLAQLLDAKATALVSDVKNQLIVKELVQTELSVTELANRLNLPVVTLWKRLQKLAAAGIVEVSRVRRYGNLEKKFYRASAARFIPAELLELKPNDRRLAELYRVFSEIHKEGLALATRMNEIPDGKDPVDYGIYVSMAAFVRVCTLPGFQGKVAELSSGLAALRQVYLAPDG